MTTLIAVICWIEHSPVLRESAALWMVSDPLVHADAIVVLGGGVDQRPFLAAHLYREGLANKSLVADVTLRPIEKLGKIPPHADLNREVLLRLGMPQEAIMGFGTNVSSTLDESNSRPASLGMQTYLAC
jgi:hypothetical protein